MEYPHRMGYPLAEMGYNPVEMMYLLDGMGYPSGIGYAWTRYAAGGIPLTVFRRRAFLYEHFLKKPHEIKRNNGLWREARRCPR